MEKSFRLSRRQAQAARWFKKCKISGLVLKNKFVLYLNIALILQNPFLPGFFFSLKRSDHLHRVHSNNRYKTFLFSSSAFDGPTYVLADLHDSIRIIEP